MTSTSRDFAAILLLLLVAVDFGGGSLLTMLTRRIPGYLDNPLRQNMWRPASPPGLWLGARPAEVWPAVRAEWYSWPAATGRHFNRRHRGSSLVNSRAGLRAVGLASRRGRRRW